ncbi:E2/UBC family protein [Methylobacterium sp. Leaf100]|uniref:E2/UBC family protein n=1 Tax=Methylobacterium sp. Leaf100 TaxID=1736252 RepID=UPI0006F836F9|nr:E2/UBC family protein [Methylobacterium sp. Leaf100]KQP32826.1 hypothetical protein ASF25_17565 [Methylobacterium sp. Leaf100]
MSFLPEDDRDFLADKAFSYEEVSALPGQRAIIVKGVPLPPGKFLAREPNGVNVAVAACDVLVMVPDGYPNTTLDSFYIAPHLCLAASLQLPPNTGGPQPLFGRDWQFWSRHLTGPHVWRAGVDGLQTYWNLILYEIRRA